MKWTLPTISGQSWWARRLTGRAAAAGRSRGLWRHIWLRRSLHYHCILELHGCWVRQLLTLSLFRKQPNNSATVNWQQLYQTSWWIRIAVVHKSEEPTSGDHRCTLLNWDYVGLQKAKSVRPYSRFLRFTIILILPNFLWENEIWPSRSSAQPNIQFSIRIHKPFFKFQGYQCCCIDRYIIGYW